MKYDRDGNLLWPQQIGYALAKEFLYTGRLVTMQEAAQMGLINYAVPREELLRELGIGPKG